ncbi:MAG: hydantoinase/oxoprolinase family protein [Tissierellales bacterium]|nr:hydantoinase/oxoprolinase family protein [Tissierellales bacterium]
MSRYRISVDIGGTFTDFIFFDKSTGEFKEGKVLTTPNNLSEAIINGIDMEIKDYSDIDFFVHGTTTGLNAFLERKGVNVAIVTTKGFRDVYELARGDRPEMYDRFYKKPKPLVERNDIYEVEERVSYDGEIIKKLNKESVETVIQEIKKKGYDSVVVCLINSYIFTKHEEEVKEIFNQFIPSIPITMSHDIAREWREYERTSTATINAYISPIVERYIKKLESEMKEKNYNDTIHIMQSNGGIMTSEVAKEKPILTLMSGPVGGAIGKNSLYETLGYKNLIGIDMGGTSFDVSMLIDGKPDLSTETYLEGFPILSPMVNIYTIGAGGGSLVSFEGNGLRVGPESAGSNPGPACYGKGGNKATVTDANLILGRIDADNFLGGRMNLDVKASQNSLQDVAKKINLNIEETAEGVIRIANANMAGIIRQITVRKGIDPREFAIVAFGGAGPMHAVEIAEELGVNTIIVPEMPGTYSAWGMHQCDIRQDSVRTYRSNLDNMDINNIKSLYKEMEKEVSEILVKQNIEKNKIQYKKTIDMRYVGQDYTLNVDFTDDEITNSSIDNLKKAYNEFHQQIYGHHNPSGEIETVNIRLAGIGLIDRIERVKAEEKETQVNPYKVNKVVFNKKKYETGIYQRDHLEPGTVIHGPAIIEELSSTTVVPPEYGVKVDGYNNIIIKRK